MAKKTSAKKGLSGGKRALLASAPARQTVTASMVKQAVIDCIAKEARLNQADTQKPDKFAKLINGDTTLDLETDLNIDSERRAALHQCYEKTSQSFGGSPISRNEAQGATTVDKAIKLVVKAANE